MNAETIEARPCEIQLSCLYCGEIESLDASEVPPGVLYFCSMSCQDAYHSEMDPNNAVASEEG